VIAANLEAARKKLAHLNRLQGELETLVTQPTDRLAGLLAWGRQQAVLLGLKDPAVAPEKKTREFPEPGRPFRRYRVEDKWEVWIGRNNRENDELTHRAAAPNDLWFHAQGVPGSHVILRTRGKPEQVPKSILAKAAALAALNSRARTSTLVPVVYTRRKYVRKPRGSPPGTAACIREKSLMVKPRRPPGVEGI
jgi:predicted ribosome quality control (RQC) complex YloA/Tae2 family protein